MKLNNKKGFTLIELIIVIAILGIIALIAIPNLAGIRQRSQVSADKRTAEQIGKAVRIWATDVDAGATRTIPGTATKYDAAWAEASGVWTEDEDHILAGLCETYISKGYEAKSLTGGPGYFYVASVGTGDNNANQKILVGISKVGTDLTATGATRDSITYKGSEAAWAYLEQ